MKGSTTLSKSSHPDVFHYMQKDILKVKDEIGKYVISLYILFIYKVCLPYSPNEINILNIVGT